MSDDDPIELSTRADLTRRDALKALAGAAALLKTGCLEPPGEAVRPYVHAPPAATPGVPVLYATAMTIDGFATGLVAEAHVGRPIKIEGNPLHPASLGATNAIHQATILDLYHPARLRAVYRDGLPSSWRALAQALDRPPPGELWLVLPPHSSPTIARLLERVRARHPEVRIVHHAAVAPAAAYRGAALAYGEPLQVQLDLARADVVVALDADVLGAVGYPVAWARAFAARHRITSPFDDPGRLYVAEPMPSPTGSLADRRLAIPAGDVAAIAAALATELGRIGVPIARLPDDLLAAAAARLDAPARAWVTWVARDLARRPAASAIVAGERQPPGVHALVHVLNGALGNLGSAVALTPAPLLDPLPELDLTDLAAAARAGRVGAVVIGDCNPVYTSRRDAELADALARVPLTVHHTLFEDETSAACRWVAPASHWLEAWGDGRAWDGTAAIAQPLIRPLYASVSELELIALLAGIRTPDALDLVRETWTDRLTDARGFDAAWSATLAAGVVPGSGFRRVTPRARLAEDVARGLTARLAARGDGAVELDLAPSPSIHDGRFGANAWLQELPRPFTKQTWGNAAVLGVGTAARLGVEDGEIVRLRTGERVVEVPAIVLPTHAEGAVSLDLGYGRYLPAQPLVDRLGADGYALLGDVAAPLVVTVEVIPTGRPGALARTQITLDSHDRELAPVLELSHLRDDPDLLAGLRGPLPSLLPELIPEDEVPQWAMTIDTSICTGCASCVVACQAENNVPVVGPEGVRRGRIMHWLRIDQYVHDDGATVNQPMLCQHCEKAPCEYVCPVFATTHSPDGLNEMTYNRCVGTRFCSNNCPYKVRRFNWFDYNSPPTTAALQHNPDVTVRARGVMEKCTYCVQRIRGAEIASRMANRPIRPGEVVTACQQACPTGAIQFGALQHTDTLMVQWRRDARRYDVLHHLGTRPRTVYLARVRVHGEGP